VLSGFKFIKETTSSLDDTANARDDCLVFVELKQFLTYNSTLDDYLMTAT